LIFNEHLSALELYEAGKPIELLVREFGVPKEKIIKMASNENPFGMSPKVSNAISENSQVAYMYPDDSMFELKDGLSKKFEVDENQIVIGAGSDQVLEMISRAKLNGNSKVLMNKITFAMYSIYAKQMGAEILTTDSTHHDLKQFLEISQKENPDLIYICTPNNPTGDALTKNEVYEFLEKISPETLVVVDGAYMEYAIEKDESYKIEPKELIEKFPNVIYTGTFSKAYGLGGMRVGYGIAQRNIVTNILKMRPPFNITTLSLLASIEALKDWDFVKDSIDINFNEMERYKDFVKNLGFDYIESYTNFITILLSDRYNSTTLSDKLLKEGIIVRDLRGYNLNAIRVTIGKPEENSRFFEVFENIIK
jgi:histidinol-phosphate aminotransferase